jgi:protein required for attachment to host cells
MRNDTTWILVMNGTRARIIRGLPGNGETTLDELVLRSEHKRLKDIMADKPGRSFSIGSGGRRSAMEYGSDPLAEDERDFLRRVIDLLDAHRRAGDFTSLAVFAEPSVLGEFRKLVPGPLAAKIQSEHAANLLHLAPRELAEKVGQELGLA